MKKLVFDAKQLAALEIADPDDAPPASAAVINASVPFPPQQLILLLSDTQWEEFIKEWAYCQKQKYLLVSRMGGANDFGIDVACFATEFGFLGEWENFQCKHYKGALAPSDGIPEVGKLLWHIYCGHITTPSAYYFFAPKDCGPSLKKLLLNADELKKYLFENWAIQCSKSITSKQEIKLEGDFLTFVKAFNFSIFKYKPTHEVIEDHKSTPYHTSRFGGGLGERPKSDKPPSTPSDEENRYIEQLLEAYSDCSKDVSEFVKIQEHPSFKSHFDRSRESFYEAEALHTFARDSVPNGTFENLQDEVLFGVKDIEEDEHETAFKRVREVTKTAATLNVQASGLYGVVGIKDLQGICHQLANVDRLVWKKS